MTTVAADLAPTGVLRAAINVGNPILVPESSGEPTGVTVDIARELAYRLGVPLELLSVSTAAKAQEAIADGRADVGFLAIEPARAGQVFFSAPYVLIEAVYAVAENSPIATAADVDRPGVRVGVTAESAYDLYLTRTLEHARLERSDDGERSYLELGLDVVAGLRSSIEQFVIVHPGVRILEPPFTAIRQAVGIRNDRSRKSKDFLGQLVEDLLTSGFVTESLRRSGRPEALAAVSGRSRRPPAPGAPVAS